MQPTIPELIQAILADLPVLAEADLTPDAHFRTLPGWDSLAGLMLLTLIETQYGIEVAPAELRKCQTVAEVHQLIQSKSEKV